jgi:hypothetical protein
LDQSCRSQGTFSRAAQAFSRIRLVDRRAENGRSIMMKRIRGFVLFELRRLVTVSAPKLRSEITN